MLVTNDMLGVKVDFGATVEAEKEICWVPPDAVRPFVMCHGVHSHQTKSQRRVMLVN